VTSSAAEVPPRTQDGQGTHEGQSLAMGLATARYHTRS